MNWVELLMYVVSLAATVFITSNQMAKNIDKIIGRDYVGQLTKAQALALVNIYLSTIKKELKYQVDHFLEYEIHKYRKIDTPESMENFGYGT